MKALEQQFDAVMEDCDTVDYHSDGEPYETFAKWDAARKCSEITLEHMKGFSDFLMEETIDIEPMRKKWITIEWGDLSHSEMIDKYFESLNKKI